MKKAGKGILHHYGWVQWSSPVVQSSSPVQWIDTAQVEQQMNILLCSTPHLYKLHNKWTLCSIPNLHKLHKKKILYHWAPPQWRSGNEAKLKDLSVFAVYCCHKYFYQAGWSYIWLLCGFRVCWYMGPGFTKFTRDLMPMTSWLWHNRNSSNPGPRLQTLQLLVDLEVDEELLPVWGTAYYGSTTSTLSFRAW